MTLMTVVRITTDESAYYISFALFTLWPTLVVMLFCSGVPAKFDCNILNDILEITTWIDFFEINEAIQAKNFTSGKTATE